MRNVFKIVSALAVLASAGTALAEHPCKRIENACASAGYVKGGSKAGKGIAKDCVKPILAGQAVQGVAVAPEDVQACNAKRASKHVSPPNGGMPPPAP